MKYSDYIFYLFFCVFLFLIKVKPIEYIYHKKIIEKKDREKEKIFNHIRSQINEDVKEKNFFLTLEEKRDIFLSSDISSSLKQKLALSKSFNVKNNSIEQKDTNAEQDLLSEITVSFLFLKEQLLKNYFDIHCNKNKNNSFLFSIFIFLVSSLIKKGIALDISLDYAKEILMTSNFNYFFIKTSQFDILDFLLFLKEKFIMDRDSNLLFNKKAKHILKKIIVWDTKDKIEHERALNQFYNMAKRKSCCAVFSFYAQDTKRVSGFESYGDLHLDCDVYRSVLFDYNSNPSLVRRRSFFDLKFPKKEKTFFMVPMLKSNMVKYVAPVEEKISVEEIFSYIRQSENCKLCSIIFLDEEDIRFLLY